MKIPAEIAAALVSLAAIFGTAAAFFPPAAARQPAERAAPSGQDPAPSPISEAAASEPPRAAPLSSEETPVLLLRADGTVETLSLGDYLYGVVGGEMPAIWPLDALKAQAVAARTYALCQAESGKHAGQGAQVCDDSTCCQAYQTADVLQEKWGADSALYEEKVRQAVAETRGQVLTYAGEPISAVYHAASVGTTNAAVDVWGREVPYLISVDTPGDERKGHGVGMSQWGAKLLAQEGMDYRDILAHYYPGTTLETWED